MVKIYELTSNRVDGYRKVWVSGIGSDKEAKQWSKKLFKDKYWTEGVSFYDRVEDARKRGKKKYWWSKTELKNEIRRRSKR